MQDDTTKQGTWTLPYTPSEVQLRAHALQVDELLAGGAAGGGKAPCSWDTASLIA